MRKTDKIALDIGKYISKYNLSPEAEAAEVCQALATVLKSLGRHAGYPDMTGFLDMYLTFVTKRSG